MSERSFNDIFAEMLGQPRSAAPLPDNTHSRRAHAHLRAALRWPEGSAIRGLHAAAAASDARLATEAA